MITIEAGLFEWSEDGNASIDYQDLVDHLSEETSFDNLMDNGFTCYNYKTGGSVEFWLEDRFDRQAVFCAAVRCGVSRYIRLSVSHCPMW